jgi:hypothetical protein
MSMEFPEPYNPDESSGGYELMPPGEYVAQAIEASIAPPRTGNGLALTLVWKILEGEHETRQLWQNISFVHPKAGAQYHGQKMLNAVIAATGAPTPLPSAQPLLFVPCRIGVAIETDKNGVYDDKNRVVKVSPLDNNEAAEAAPSPAPAPKPAPAGAAAAPTGTAPWHKQKSRATS